MYSIQGPMSHVPEQGPTPLSQEDDPGSEKRPGEEQGGVMILADQAMYYKLFYSDR